MKAEVEGRAKRIFVNVPSTQKFFHLVDEQSGETLLSEKKSFFDDIVDDVDDNDDN